ncbi:MAG TPA: sensor histidine kinase [Actinopolymorphaceae bacterium]
MSRAERRYGPPASRLWERLVPRTGGTVDWARVWERSAPLLPYPLLAIAVVVYLAPMGGRPWVEVAPTLALAVVAAFWTLGMYTLAPERRRTAGWLLVYFAGFLLLTALLMSQSVLFFVFAISGFFHAHLLRPVWLGVAGITCTSIILNTGTMGLPSLALEELLPYLAVIAIQSSAISLGLVVGEHMAKEQEKRRRMLIQLEESLEENVGLHAQLLTQAREAGINDERQRMAREIHDTLAQGLAGIITQLEAAQQAKDRPEVWQRHLDNAKSLARASLTDARRSVHAVRPAQLEAARLPEALADVAARWSRLSDVEVEVTTTGTSRPLYPEVEVTLLRVGQEALTNVAKHARASTVHLTLSYMEDVVSLDIRDDGRGFDPARLARVRQKGDANLGFGLTGMRQRIRRLAGSFDVESEPGGGTVVSATVPAIPATADHAERTPEAIPATTGASA